METSSSDLSTANAMPPQRVKDKDACLREIGYAIIYMKYLHPEWLEMDNCREQYRRVKILMKQIAVSWHRDEAFWWEQMFDSIMNEIENMC